MRITPEGDALAEKRCAAQSEVADRILSTLTPEEVESLNVLTEKIIHQCKDMGVRGERSMVAIIVMARAAAAASSVRHGPDVFSDNGLPGGHYFSQRLFLT